MMQEIEEKLVQEYSKTTDLKVLQVENTVAKPMISLHLILEDIKLAKASAQKALSIKKIEIDPLIIDALWQQSLMAYARIFSNSDDGFSKLEPSIFIKSKKDENLHKELMEIRHSFLAHRGLNTFVRSVMTVIPAEYEGRPVLAYTFPTAKRIGHYLSKGERTLFIGLLDKLERRVEKCLSKKFSRFEYHVLKDYKGYRKFRNK